jgi:uncharacterized membrane protein
MDKALLLIFYLVTPAVVIYLCHRYSFFSKIGAVVITYVLGLIAGNTGILPANVYELQDLLLTLTIPLAIPLMLFSMNVKKWLVVAPKTMLSMLFALVGVLFTVIPGYFIFKKYMPETMWQISGLLVGVYTGGTPNMASIKMAIGVDESLYLATHTYDLVVGVVYLMFMLTLGKRFFNLFLPRFRFPEQIPGQMGTFSGMESYEGIFSKKSVISMLKATGIAVVIFAIGGSFTFILPENTQMAAVILTITTLGIVASLIPQINRLEKTFELGMYLILVFSLVVASMANMSNIVAASPSIFLYITLVIFGSLLIQTILSKIFKVDTDTMMITSTAFICSPPFVPVVASSLKNKEIIISGLTVGIIGYAIGNYLGISIAYLLK